MRSRAATRTVHRAGLHCWQTLWSVFVGASARAHIGVCYIYTNLDWKRQAKCWNLQCMIKRTKHTSHSPHRRSRPHTLGTHTLYSRIRRYSGLRHRTEPAEQRQALLPTLYLSPAVHAPSHTQRALSARGAAQRRQRVAIGVTEAGRLAVGEGGAGGGASQQPAAGESLLGPREATLGACRLPPKSRRARTLEGSATACVCVHDVELAAGGSAKQA